ncbi:DUF3806 domain-containing protein [Dasania marina]|uniref:DUF3806 domain-containing protein n=1 Tax=Dasania marina TaxID=471499 RepID=UPI00036344B5|nr:DUF3806 domain-containing protein [Dasania marina]|tara:strand:- start:15309 stop:15812 length:504 start_codon:yes stop_codon:yes gene_type:complete
MHKQRYLTLFCLLISCCFSLNSYAQEWRKEPLTTNDQTFMAKQRDSIDELTRRHFGRQLTGKKDNDFALMQRLLDEKIIKPEQVVLLQAMGVILGNVLKEHEGLSWVIYIDRYGRSRALDVPGKRDVVFPITMISRRYETGGEVNIEQLYQKAVASVATIKKQIIVY